MARAGHVRHVPFAFSAFRRHSGQKSILSANAYASEREQVRRRELNGAGAGTMAAWAKRQFHVNAGRLRGRLAMLVPLRRDLEGRPIRDLSCATYWPGASAGNSST